MRRSLLILGLLALVFGTAPVARADIGGFLEIQDAVHAARDRVLPSLVRVQPISEVYVGGRKVKRTGFGSGVIFTHEGHVLTNFHVAGRAKNLICVLSDKEEVPAKLVAGDDGVNVRSGPDVSFPKLGYLDPGTSAEVTGKYEDWFQIDYNDGPGWVFGELVAVTNTDSVPVVQPPASP